MELPVDSQKWQLVLLVGMILMPVIQIIRFSLIKRRTEKGAKDIAELIGYAVAAFLFWGVYEYLMPPGMNIRVDLVLFFPFLIWALIQSVILPLLLYRRRPADHPSPKK